MFRSFKIQKKKKKKKNKKTKKKKKKKKKKKLQTPQKQLKLWREGAITGNIVQYIAQLRGCLQKILLCNKASK